MNEDGIRAKMEEAVTAVRSDVSSIRTGRATPALVADIIVDAYGGTTRLKIVELASIATPDPRTLIISPWDKSITYEIKKAIETANIGLTPMADGEAIRINLPSLTAEDRRNYVKLLSQKLENGKIMIRRVRQEAMEEVHKLFEKKEFGEDEKFQREERVQKITDEMVNKIEEIGKLKEAELTQV